MGRRTAPTRLLLLCYIGALGACGALAACDRGRLADFPPDFKRRQRKIAVSGAHSKPALETDAGLLNDHNRRKLERTATRLDYATMLTQAARGAIPRGLRGIAGAGGGGPLAVKLRISKVSLAQANIAADWRVRVEATAELRGRRQRVLWRYGYVDTAFSEYKLSNLTAAQLTAGGGARLRAELLRHLRTVVRGMLVDLDAALVSAKAR